MDRVPPRSVLDLRDSANPSGPACTVGECCRSSTAFQSRLAVTVHGPERFLGRICSYGACPVMAGRTLPPQLERLYSVVVPRRPAPAPPPGRSAAPAAWMGLQLAEDDRPVAGEDYPPFSVPADGIRERLAFGVAANRDQVRGGVRVVHLDDLLRDDGPFVQ